MSSRKSVLYKYTKIEHVKSSLDNGVFASKLTDFNDPYEYFGISNPDDYRVVCLTRSNNAKLMWSHYANGHKGCSLQIEVPEGYLQDNYILRSVKYGGIKEREGLSVYEGLYVKDKKWKSELEERAVCNLNDYDASLWNKVGNDYYFKVRMKAVILGCMSDKDPNYIEVLKAIKNYNDTDKGKVFVKKLMMRSDKFKFVQNKNFNYLDEIELYDKGGN